MGILNKVIYLNEAQLEGLKQNGSITVNGVDRSIEDGAIYLVPNDDKSLELYKHILTFAAGGTYVKIAVVTTSSTPYEFTDIESQLTNLLRNAYSVGDGDYGDTMYHYLGMCGPDIAAVADVSQSTIIFVVLNSLISDEVIKLS